MGETPVYVIVERSKVIASGQGWWSDTRTEAGARARFDPGNGGARCEVRWTAGPVVRFQLEVVQVYDIINYRNDFVGQPLQKPLTRVLGNWRITMGKGGGGEIICNRKQIFFLFFSLSACCGPRELRQAAVSKRQSVIRDYGIPDRGRRAIGVRNSCRPPIPFARAPSRRLQCVVLQKFE